MSFNLKIKFSLMIIPFVILEIVLLILKDKTKIEFYGFLFVFFMVVFGVDIIILVINCFLSNKIKINRKIQSKINEGDYLKIELKVSNNNVFPLINLEVEDFLSCADKDKEKKFILDWIRPKFNLNLIYGCICDLRGEYVLNSIKINFFGFLRFFYVQRNWGKESIIYVYPKIFKIKEIGNLTKGYLPWFGVETIFASGDDHEFFGLREYKRGDSLKRIHWLSVARKNQLIVREFQRCNFNQAAIMFVLGEEYRIGKCKEMVSEYIVKLAASLTAYFIEKNICIEIIAHAGKIVHFPFNKGYVYKEEIFKFYAEAKAESKISMENFVDEYDRFIPSNVTIFVLLTENELNALIRIMYFKSRNISIIAIIIISSTFLDNQINEYDINCIKNKILAKFLNTNIKFIFINKGDFLETVFEKVKL